jgi:hypothetical protein
MKTLHTQAIEVKFLEPTNTKGSRIQLKDMRFNTRITLSFDYSIGNVITQATEYLESKGYIVICYSANSNDTYFIMCDSVESSFIKLEK